MSSGGSDQTIGYKYAFGIHMGICRGPVDALVEVRVGDRTAWPIPVTVQTGMEYPEEANGIGTPVYDTIPPEPPKTESGTIVIWAPGLFGGDRKEGGIQGPAQIMMGEKTQQPNPSLMQMLGQALLPAYRGVFTIFFDGWIAAMNPYPKPWTFRVQRALKGWDRDECWYPEKAKISLCDGIEAMNPAHIIYECATNRAWGRGLDRSLINEESFIAVANTLAEECFGLCFLWSRENDIAAFVNQVINHIGAALYPDRTTGKLTLRLIRDNYVVANLPLFDEASGLLDIQEEEGTTSSNLRNEIVVRWRHPPTDEERVYRVRNIAALQSLGGISSEVIDYIGIPTAELAERVARRDLRARGMPLRRFKLTLDRRADLMAPGEPFRISDPTTGVGSVVVRAGKIEDTENGDIIVTVVEDVFGLPAVAYSVPQPGGQIPQITAPVAPAYYRVIEAPYGDVARIVPAAQRNQIPEDSGFILGMAAAPTPLSINYAMFTGTAGENLANRGDADFSPMGLILAMGAGDIVVKFDSFANLGLVTPDEALICENEIMRIVAINTEALTLTVERGCFDTIPAKHPIGARAFAYQRFHARDNRNYLDGDNVRMRFATKTFSAMLNVSEAPQDTVVMDQRIDRPYPPAKVMVGTVPFHAEPTVLGDVVLTWNHRDRLLQDDRLIGHQQPSVGPEAGTTYTVRVRDGFADDVFREVTGITGDTWTYTQAMSDADVAGENLIIELWSVRDGLTSLQRYSFPVRRLPEGTTGYGLAYDESYGE